MNLAPLARRFSTYLGRQARRQSARDLLTTTGANLVIAGTSAVGGVLAARLLGPAGRGELAVAVAWAAILTVIASLGLPQALTYSVARDTSGVGRVFHTSLLLLALQNLFILVIGQVVIALWLARLQPAAVRSAQLYLFSIPAGMLLTYLSSIAQGLQRFRLFNAFRAASSTGYLFALSLALLLGLNQARGLIALMLAFQWFVAAAALVIFVRQVRPRGGLDWAQARELLQYGLRSYWGSLSWMANLRLDQFIMSAFVGLNALGLYAVAVSYATVIFPISGAFAMVIFPRVAQDNYGGARSRIVRALKLNLLASGTAALGLGVVAHILLPLLFGSQFAPAVIPAYVLLVAGVFLGCSYVLSDGLRGLGFPGIPSLAEAMGVVVTVGGLLLLLPLAGVRGAALVSLLSYAVVTLTMFLRFMGLSGRAEDRVVPAGERQHVA
jgi:O-antigen/teichoic acid export membrane protein